jgi:hypothetical protein
LKDSRGFGVHSPLDLDNCGTEKVWQSPRIRKQGVNKEKAAADRQTGDQTYLRNEKRGFAWH